MLVVFLCILTLYVLTAPPSVVFEDDGEFIMAVRYLGVAHPPGYPLFVLLAHPFTWLPIGSVAWRVHVASSVFAAASCAVLWRIARTLVPGRAAAYVAALGLGVSLTFWSQAIIAEVYSLNVLLILLSLSACLAFLRSPGPGPLRALALMAGLALNDHWPLALLAAPGLLVILWPARAAVLRHLPREAPRLALLLALGLSPYMWVVVRSRTAPDLAFFSSLDSWSEIRDYLLRSSYARGGDSVSAGMWDKLQFGAFYGREILRQYTPVGALLAGVGAVAGWRRWRAPFCVGLVLAFLGATLGLILMLRVDYEFVNRAVLKVFPVVPYAVMALWVALGFHEVTTRLHAGAHGGAVAGGLGAALILLLLAVNYPENNRRDYAFADRWGRAVLSTFQPGATVLTRRDHETFVLGYLHWVEGVRPDLRLMQDWGVGVSMDGRLFHPLELTPEEKDRRVAEFAQASGVPVYFFVRPPEPLGFVDLGLYWRVDPGVPEGEARMSLDSRLRPLFQELVSGPASSDAWTEYVRAEQIAGMSRVLTAIVYLYPAPDLPESLREDLDRASRHYLGLMERISLLTNQGGAPLEELLAWTDRAEEMLDETVSKANRANLFLVRGKILASMGRRQDALTSFDQSISAFSNPSNPSFGERRRLLAELRGSEG